MATGWAKEGAVQDQIDATVKDAVKRAQSNLPTGPGLSHCAECAGAVSYTHLDVYKRQIPVRATPFGIPTTLPMPLAAAWRGSIAT